MRGCNKKYDIDIKPTKLVQGNGLCRVITKNQVEKCDIKPKVLMVSLQDPWFSNIAHFLTYGEFPSGLTYK